MRFLLALILLVPFGLNAATVFTEFYCDSGVGTNINSGSTTNAAAIYTSVNGNWDGTSVFTPADGSTPASTVTNGSWVSVYVDGSTNLVQSGAGGFIALVTNVAAGVNGAITIDRAAFSGTAPSSSATARSLKMGGAWNGPYGTIGFPFGFLATTATNAANVFPRCNFKATSQYNITAAMTHSNAGPTRFQGMTLTPDDGGKATIDGGNPGTSYIMLTVSSANIDLCDFVIQNNGTAGGASTGVLISGSECMGSRLVFSGMRRSGIQINAGTYILLTECEAFNCNAANQAGHGGFLMSAPMSTAIRCVSHDNAGSASSGFVMSGNPSFLLNSIAYLNGGSGITVPAASGSIISSSDCYNNAGAGIDFTATVAALHEVQNCNFIKNGTFGITSSGSGIRNGEIMNCGFGSGTMTNASGSIASNLGGMNELGSILYAADQTPWTDPANGDFRINLTAAKSAGRGLFTQSTVNSPTNTVAFPDIGAAQSASTNAAAAGGGSYTFAQ